MRLLAVVALLLPTVALADVAPPPGGCGCAAAGPEAGLAWILVALVALAARR